MTTSTVSIPVLHYAEFVITGTTLTSGAHVTLTERA
jgi:hypothetical protein